MAFETTADEAGLKSGSHVPGNTRGTVKALWIFTLLWNAISAPVLIYIPPELARQPLAALGFLFPIVGAGLIAWASITTARWKRFGETWLDTVGPQRSRAGPGRPSCVCDCRGPMTGRASRSA